MKKEFLLKSIGLIFCLFSFGNVWSTGTESFNHSSTSSSYGTITWTGNNGLTWTANDARGDQVVTTSNKAICIRQTAGKLTGSLTAIQKTEGIGIITFKAKNTASSGDNSKTTTYQFKCGSITRTVTVPAMGSNAVTVTSPIINSTDATSIEIAITGEPGVRITMDDLSWTNASSDPTINAVDLNFDEVLINTNTNKIISVIGQHLNDNITSSITGTGFSLTSGTTLPKDGGNVEVDFLGTAVGTYNGTLTFTSGAISKTINLTATVISPIIDLPFTFDFSAVGGSSEASGGSSALITTAPVGFLNIGTAIYGGGEKLRIGSSSSSGIITTKLINASGTNNIEVSFTALAWPQSSGTKEADISITYGDVTKVITIEGKTGWPLDNSELLPYSTIFAALSTPTVMTISTIYPTSKESRAFLNNLSIKDASVNLSETIPLSHPIFTTNGTINIQLDAPQTITIYNIQGQALLQNSGKEGWNQINVSNKGIVVVKVGNTMTKVML